MQLVNVFGDCCEIDFQLISPADRVELKVITPFIERVARESHRITIPVHYRHHEINRQSVTMSLMRCKFSARFLAGLAVDKNLIWHTHFECSVSLQEHAMHGAVYITATQQATRCPMG